MDDELECVEDCSQASDRLCSANAQILSDCVRCWKLRASSGIGVCSSSFCSGPKRFLEQMHSRNLFGPLLLEEPGLAGLFPMLLVRSALGHAAISDGPLAWYTEECSAQVQVHILPHLLMEPSGVQTFRVSKPLFQVLTSCCLSNGRLWPQADSAGAVEKKHR